jgi:hypothetical protein
VSAEDKKDGDLSSPNIDDLDSAWDSDDDELDEDATTVQRIPKELVALSRRGTEIEEPPKKEEAPEKHEAITARPPPVGTAEPSVVVDAPHEQLAGVQERTSEVDEDEADEARAEREDDAAVAEAEERRAAAADEAAGLDAEARRRAAEARAAVRKDKQRAKTLAAREKRKAHVESQRQKAKKPKRRSIPPRESDAEGRAKESKPPASRERTTGRPAPMPSDNAAALVAPNRDVLRMVFLVAVVVVLGALVLGLVRR